MSELVVSLKTISAGPASEWITVHGENPDEVNAWLDQLENGLGLRIANVAQALRAESAVVGGTQAPVQQVQAAPVQQAAPAQAAGGWGAPAPQAQAAPAQQAPAQQWAAQPQQGAAPQGGYAPPAPGPAPMGSDGYQMVWKHGIGKNGKPWKAWFSGAPRDFQGVKAEGIFIRD